jgi:hypothetical protein
VSRAVFQAFTTPWARIRPVKMSKVFSRFASLLRGIFEAKNGERGFGAASRSVVPSVATGARFAGGARLESESAEASDVGEQEILEGVVVGDI